MDSQKIIIRAQFGEHLEYFIETTEKTGLDYRSIKGFLVRRLDAAPDYLTRLILEAILAADVIVTSDHGFPVIGETCQGAARHAMMHNHTYTIQFSTVYIQKLED